MDRTNANTALCSAFTEELARCGVRRAIVSPGSRSTPLAVALWRQPEIEVTVVVDERSAGFMALGAAMASRSPVVLLCTSGTAGANYHPAVAEADLSAIPLIVLTADRPPELRDNGSGQTIDQIKLFGETVRWFSEVGSHLADDDGLLHMRTTACRAFATAVGDPRPGPVHLNFPLRDPLAPIPVSGSVTASSPLALDGREGLPLVAIEPNAPGPPSSEVMSRIATRLTSTERVLILVGRQADPRLRDPISRLAERLDCPILAEPTSQLLCGGHDRSRVIPGYARLGASAHYGVSGFADHPELAPEVVLRFGEMPTSKGLRLWLSGSDEIDQIVFDPTHGFHEPTGRASLILRSDPVLTAVALTESVPTERPPAAASFLAHWRTAAEALPEPDPSGTGPLYRQLAEAMPENGQLYVNSSMPIRDLEAFTPSLPTDLAFFANRGANGIDGLIASGLGAALATGRPTVIATGDVGFLHDIGSLANWRRCENRPHVLLIDNRGGAIFNRLPQREAMPADEFEALMATPPDLEPEAAANLFGLPYRELTAAGDLATILAEDPALVHIKMAR